MASLTQDSRGRSPFWVCCYTSGDGRRLKKSTKITVKPLPGEKRKDGTPKNAADKKREAVEFCLALERAENSAKAGTLTEQTARKLIAEIVERTSGGKLHDHTAEGWLNEWCAGKADTKSIKTAERYGQVTRDFLESLGGRAGIAGKITRHTEGGRANSSLSFHSLRHSFNSAMANAGVSQEIRQKLTGHASAEMNKIYTHHELEPLRAAIATLPAIGTRG
jgi:hypothetical protein